MRKLFIFVLALAVLSSIYYGNAHCETTCTQLSFEKTFSFGYDFNPDSIDVFEVLPNGTFASVLNNHFFLHDSKGCAILDIELYHPELSHSQPRAVDLIITDDYILIPTFDYQSEKSYCISIYHQDIITFSPVFSGVVNCCEKCDDSIVMAGSIIEKSNKSYLMSPWYVEVAMDGKMISEWKGTPVIRNNFLSSASIDCIVSFDHEVFLVENRRIQDDPCINIINLKDLSVYRSIKAIDISCDEKIQVFQLQGVIVSTAESFSLFGKYQSNGDLFTFIYSVNSNEMDDCHLLGDLQIVDCSRNTQDTVILCRTPDESELKIIFENKWDDNAIIHIESGYSIDHLAVDMNGQFFVAGIQYSTNHNRNQAYIGMLK